MDAENTPRTDAALLRYDGGEPVTFRGITLVVDADFARQLERELREVQQKNVAWALGIEQSNTDIVDMQRDEFRRIIAITDNQEIKGICERAIAVIEQTVPVVVQRDNAENERDELRRQNEILRSKDNRWRKSNQSLINHNESLKDAIQALKDIIDENRNDPENIAEIINGAIKLTAQPEPKPCPRCGQVPDMPFHTCMEQSEEKTK